MEKLDKKDNFDVTELLLNINTKHLIKKYITFIFGLFLTAFAFTIFYSPNDIVCGGTTGLSIIFRELLNINPSLFIAISSLILLIFSLIFLGWETTTRTVVGTVLYPVFIMITEILAKYIQFGSSSMFLTILFGGIIYGLGLGLMLKTGFSNGGTMILNQILNKYCKISIGHANLIVNIAILILGAFVFGIDKTIYALSTIYIYSVVTDRVIIGVSKSKTFYIVTDKDEEVKEIIINKLGHSATIIDARGGYSNKKNKIIMATIPTKEYFIVKEFVQELDKNSFFLITDTYEVSGGR